MNNQLKRKLLILLSLVFILNGCSKVKNGINSKDELVVDSTSENSYRCIVNNEGTKIREIFNTEFLNNQQDFMKIGKGLELLSLDYFNVETHYMKESEHLTYKVGTEDTGDYFHMMYRPDVYETTSIQPYKADVIDGVSEPMLFGTMYAVDFYTKSNQGYELAGMAITAVLLPDYTDRDTQVTQEFSDSTIETYAKRAIPRIYEYYQNESGYEELKNLPILINIYQEAKATDHYSGRYIYSALCKDNTVGEIKSVNQHTYIFPSKDASAADSTTSNEFTLFKSKLKEASIESVGIIGYGEYYNGKILSMNIEVNAVFKVYDEYKAIGQYIAQLLNDQAFSEKFEIKVKLNSNTKTIGWIIKEKDGQAKFYMI